MTRLLNSIRDRWIRFWFAPAAATNLGVSRVLFFGALAAFYIPHNFSIWGSVSPAFLQPIWLFETFRVPVLSPAMLVVAETVWKLSLVLSCLGLFSSAQHGGSGRARHLSARAAPQFRADLPFRRGPRARLLDSGVLPSR